MAGKWEEGDFEAGLYRRIREELRAKLDPDDLRDLESGVRQPQPIEVELLGAYLKACGDPDWSVMKEFRVGVRIGVGVELPRTPVVFEEKQKWSLPEQAPHSGWSFDEDTFVGAKCQNYTSAKDFAEEVRFVLEDQVCRGQILKMPEAEAVAEFGTVASLGAIEKGQGPTARQKSGSFTTAPTGST